MNFISRFRNTRQAWIRGLIVSSVFFSGLGVTEFLVNKLGLTMAMETRLDAEQIITHLGYNIESRLKSYAIVASTIKSYIRLNKGKLTNDQVSMLLAQVFEQSEYLRNIGLAPANRLTYVYPTEGNEAAIGLYYPNLTRQWPSIQRSQEHNQPTILGPIDLVQGGRALLYYTPVFLEDGSYWGVISFVIDANRFFNGTLLTFGGMIQPAALRYKPDESGTHDVFWGDALTFSGQPVLSDVAAPGVDWQLALSPDLPDTETLNNVRLQGDIVSVLLALLTLALLKAQARYVASYNRLVSISSQIPGVAFQYYTEGERKGQFSYLSLGVRELYAVDPQTACTEGGSLFVKLMPEDRERIQSDVLNSALGLTRWHGLYRLNSEELGLRWHEYDAIPTRNGNQVIWHGHIADVTDRVKAETEYATMLATTHDGFVICDYLGRFLEVNDAYCQLIGYSREELLKMSIMEVDAVSTHQQIDQNLEMIITREYARFETQHRRKDGHIIDVDVSVSALTKGDDRMIVFIRDISERKHHESRLRDSENRFRSMANSAPVLIWLSGTDCHRYWFNQVWLDFTGRTLKEESGMGWADNIHPDDQAECLRVYHESLSDNKSFVMEYRFRHRDGEYRWIRDNGVPRFEVDEGAFLGYIGSCIDVTDYRKAMDRVRESEERLQFAFDGTGDGVWDWNIPDGQIFFSLGWKEMMGYHNEDIGNSVEEWRTRIHPDDLERVVDAIRLHFAGQTPSYVSEHRMRCKDGQYRWVLDRGRLVNRDDQGNPLRMLGTHTDITAMKNAEAEMAARESRFRVLFEHTPVAYQALDKDGRFQDVNQPLCD
ncbi:MAG: PAS domain S-box protein, partial [Methylococcaceae bacterium]